MFKKWGRESLGVHFPITFELEDFFSSYTSHYSHSLSSIYSFIQCNIFAWITTVKAANYGTNFLHSQFQLTRFVQFEKRTFICSCGAGGRRVRIGCKTLVMKFNQTVGDQNSFPVMFVPDYRRWTDVFFATNAVVGNNDKWIGFMSLV